MAAFIEPCAAEVKVNGMHHKAIDALTTNETLFFRDFHPFEALRRFILPEIMEQRAASRRLTIWSAASSTGQEPYSLAMLLLETFSAIGRLERFNSRHRFVPHRLETGPGGEYSQLEVNRGLPASYLVKYFTKQDGQMVLEG